jgi:hypothetical protein
MSNELIFTIIFGLVFSAVIVLWVEGIDYMNKNHPDYKGEDFFNEEEDEKKQ